MIGLKGILKEARRRRVFRTAGIYIVAAWVAVQVFSEVFPALDISASAIRYVWLGALIGLPIAIIFGWFFDISSEGIVRTASAVAGEHGELALQRSDYLLLTALAIVALTVIFQLTERVTQQSALVEARGVAEADPLSMAVLPLENVSGDPDQVYFVNGIHDALISDLSRISGLQVTSKTSARAYANTTKSVEEICSELAISRVIEGSVLRVDDDVRVNVQLRECSSDEPIWAEAYDREVRDVLIMQSDITRSIAHAVQVALTRKESELLARSRPVNRAAYESYLRGMFHLEMITPHDMRRAEELFLRALEFDRNSALAHWGLGRACRFQLQFGQGVPRERQPECRGHQLKALAIDPDLPQVHLGLALSYWLYDYDWSAADASFQRALELNPNYAEAYMFYSHFLAHMLRWQESDTNIQRAVELDPLNPFVLGLYAAQQHLLGRLERAVDLLSRLHNEIPGFGFGYDVLWYANFKLGNFEAAVEAAKKHFSITVGVPDVAQQIEVDFAANGFESAMLALGVELEALAAEQHIQGVFVAMPFAMAGDAGKAVEWLKVGFEQRDPMMPYIGTIPSTGKIADDPRFAEVLSGMNLSLPESFSRP
jgi:TolB-like protein/tetratricopeptide (TPR) repeat protein